MAAGSDDVVWCTSRCIVGVLIALAVVWTVWTSGYGTPEPAAEDSPPALTTAVMGGVQPPTTEVIELRGTASAGRVDFAAAAAAAAAERGGRQPRSPLARIIAKIRHLGSDRLLVSAAR